MNKVLNRFRMENCSPTASPIMKSDNFNLDQCLKNDLEQEQTRDIPYASTVGSFMYAHVLRRSNIAYVVGVLGRYQSNPGVNH